MPWSTSVRHVMTSTVRASISSESTIVVARFGLRPPVFTPALAAETIPASVPKFVSRVAAVFSPIPAAPGRPSEGSPRRAASSR